MLKSQDGTHKFVGPGSSSSTIPQSRLSPRYTTFSGTSMKKTQQPASFYLPIPRYNMTSQIRVFLCFDRTNSPNSQLINLVTAGTQLPITTLHSKETQHMTSSWTLTYWTWPQKWWSWLRTNSWNHRLVRMEQIGVSPTQSVWQTTHVWHPGCCHRQIGNLSPCVDLHHKRAWRTQKRHVVYAMAPHDQVRYKYLITPMQIVSTEQALACSMQSQQPRTCQSMGPMHPMLSQKHRHQRRITTFTLTELSKIGGSITKRTHQFLMGTWSQSLALCKEHIDKILRSISSTPTVHEPCIYSDTILNNKRVLFMQQVDDFCNICTLRTHHKPRPGPNWWPPLHSNKCQGLLTL